MPALSKAQQELFGIAEHSPGKLHKENRGVLKMSHQQLHDFAATKTKGLPGHKGSLRRAAERARKRKR
jgi:hypothetical protein